MRILQVPVSPLFIFNESRYDSWISSFWQFHIILSQHINIV